MAEDLVEALCINIMKTRISGHSGVPAVDTGFQGLEKWLLHAR